MRRYGSFIVESWMDTETKGLSFIVDLKAVMKKEWADGPLSLIETPLHKLVSLSRLST